jgi:hypothetical protein
VPFIFRTQSMQSVDFYASSEEGGFEEGGGKSGAKINEFQAAWNVTNAIQVPDKEFIDLNYNYRSFSQTVTHISKWVNIGKCILCLSNQIII